MAVKKQDRKRTRTSRARRHRPGTDPTNQDRPNQEQGRSGVPENVDELALALDDAEASTDRQIFGGSQMRHPNTVS